MKLKCHSCWMSCCCCRNTPRLCQRNNYLYDFPKCNLLLQYIPLKEDSTFELQTSNWLLLQIYYAGFIVLNLCPLLCHPSNIEKIREQRANRHHRISPALQFSRSCNHKQPSQTPNPPACLPSHSQITRYQGASSASPWRSLELPPHPLLLCSWTSHLCICWKFLYQQQQQARRSLFISSFLPFLSMIQWLVLISVPKCCYPDSQIQRICIANT